MASVTLTKLWLHTASDLSDDTQLGQNAEMEEFSQPVEVRRYANGRLRSITRTGTARVFNVTVPYMTHAVLAELRARVGVKQMLRDQRGRKLWGIVGAITADEAQGVERLAMVQFAFHEVSHDEEV